MEKKVYPQINETLYTEVLDNGLTVYLLPKNDYHKTYGLFTTNYGSIDNEFVPLGSSEFTRVPDGIAHFLEHKMFEKEDGDVFQAFGRQGASANAFTSFTKTSYLFSTTDQVEKNLETLLDFVQAPYFTEETVEKEKGIIGQEIQMYQDDSDWRLFFGILGNLYPKHPLHIDIAGTVESIDQITAEDLYTCYHTFYHPSNMTLFVVGKMDPEEMMAFIRDNQGQKTFEQATPIQRHFPSETAAEIVRESSITMPVQRKKVLVGLKGLDEVPEDGAALLKYKTAMSLFLQMLFGSTSQNYLNLYNAGLLDDSFSYEFSLDRSFHFADFGGDSDQPEQLAEEIEKILLGYEESSELTEENLNLLKKKMIGKHFQSLNSLEYIANQFSQSLFGDVTLFDMLTVIDQIKLSDIKAVAKVFVKKEGLSRFYISPE
ncbi:EF-P 5-aminopentanol modification-associated protein YfmH [Candidatus Enterococcus clewellii]|uniref:M16 family peptidase n=1 Tax=Candidatus Enterococcus clewellii TaxID=1834193 RepID=A0A242K839_9ENTE|nr:pitrilysin family protein [Enterococcus sp. 9E7_DIV0242]OTP17239.1 M16 family peptidase [Enterococcus sp. 9E7_DIV0242]